MLPIEIAVILLSIVCERVVATTSATAASAEVAAVTAVSRQLSKTDAHSNSQNHKNTPAYGMDRWTPLEQPYRYVGLVTNANGNAHAETNANANSEKSTAQQRRSYNSYGSYGSYGSSSSGSGSGTSSDGDGSGGLSAVLNGLTNFAGLQHYGNGYAGGPTLALPKQTTEPLTTAKQEIPIYEDQHEDAEDSLDSVYATENNHHQQQQQIYNLHAAGVHNGGFLPAAYGSSRSGSHHQAGALSSPYRTSLASAAVTPTWSSPALPSTPQHQPNELLLQSNDKISVGNFLHHYDHNSGYDDNVEQQQQQQAQQHQFHSTHSYAQQLPHSATSFFTPATFSQQLQQHQQQQQQQLHGDIGYGDTSSASSPSAPDFEQQHDEATNYLPPAAAATAPAAHHHTDIINYVPYPVVKKLHVPVEKPVQIPVSQAIIVPVRKPVPIHIPVTQQVQVPIEKELKIPIERVVPYPVEKHVPVPVEKRVPYQVVKYVPVKVPRPFPVKVPVFKTVLHKMKSWW